MDIRFPPTGRDAKYIVTMNNQPFAGFDTHEEAYAYVQMQQSKKKGGSERSSGDAARAHAACQSWSITIRS